MSTRIITDSEPLESLLRGAEKLYKAVSTTMGPRGNNVIFRKAGYKVAVTHDGVTVAKAVKLDDEAEDVGADLLREAASKLDQTTGDGTTTVTVLAYNILAGAAERIRKGENPMRIRLELEKAQAGILKQIDAHTKKEATEEDLIAVATVSSGDKEIGEAVGKAIFNAGPDTPIMLGFSDVSETYTDVIDGFKIESGPASPYLMEGAGVRLEIETPKILVVDAKLRDKNDILPILRMLSGISQEDRKVLIVATDIAADALSLLVVNRLKGFAEIAVARMPQHIKSSPDYLKDIAIATGATVLSRNTGNSISEPSIDHLGSAHRVIVEPRETVIVNGNFFQEDKDTHIASLTEQSKSKDTAIRQFAEDRLKTLAQKVVSIKVGGQSETDAEERHYRYEDAVGAARAALRSGVVPGGGTLLYSIDTDVHLLSEALKAPLRKVLENAGIAVPEGISPGTGIDVLNLDDGVVDLVERGILDPAESEIECVKTAISIAGLLMTSGAIIVDKENKNEEAQQPINPS
jgi:chaperonin GroEL